MMIAAAIKIGPTECGAHVEGQHLELSLLVVDIVQSTEMLRELGDDRYARLIESFKDSIYEVMDSCGAYEVADTGDGFIYAFLEAPHAVDAARAMFDRNCELDRTRERPIGLRCGVHRGCVAVSRYGIVGIALYEAVELGNAAERDKIWLSMSAAAQTTHDSAEPAFVTLPRSGLTAVVVDCLGSRDRSAAKRHRASVR